MLVLPKLPTWWVIGGVARVLFLRQPQAQVGTGKRVGVFDQVLDSVEVVYRDRHQAMVEVELALVGWYLWLRLRGLRYIVGMVRGVLVGHSEIVRVREIKQGKRERSSCCETRRFGNDRCSGHLFTCLAHC